jgi:2-polyprenyl-3-methyl-5-hydroxy-6-metoxy-1,4-benzoquinol methylase
MVESERKLNFPAMSDPAAYWEKRARTYATQGQGLAAVCSYGMPGFYNQAIHLCQFLALHPFLRQAAHKRVLDVGCGIGRWSLWMASHGATVTGADLSPTMIAEARRRAGERGLSDRCQFQIADLAELNLSSQHDFIFGVTVLQHILDDARLDLAVRRLKAHLAPGGRIVLIEAAPTERIDRCDTPIFQARTESSYLQLFSRCGLKADVIAGVDPMPLKTLLLPYYARLPKWIALPALAAATALSLPVDALLGRRCARASWHKLFVLTAAGDA